VAQRARKRYRRTQVTDERRAVIRVVVHGRVQGVGYRAWVEDTAAIRGIDGWVRNRTDGTVEAVFAGAPAAVAAMVEACGRGPPSARVERVARHEAAAADLALRRAGEGFSTLPTC
jgi:acylphosphatase